MVKTANLEINPFKKEQIIVFPIQEGGHKYLGATVRKSFPLFGKTSIVVKDCELHGVITRKDAKNFRESNGKNRESVANTILSKVAGELLAHGYKEPAPIEGARGALRSTSLTQTKELSNKELALYLQVKLMDSLLK